MTPILYDPHDYKGEVDFDNNGIYLSDCISCVVEEEINGTYELIMEYPLSGMHYDALQVGMILYVPHDETLTRQPFDIYKITRPLNGIVTLYGWHISYRLNKQIELPWYTKSGDPYTATTLQGAISVIEEHIDTPDLIPFTFTTTTTKNGTMRIDVPRTVRSVLGGAEGSIIDIYGGEWEFDHYSCIHHARRGENTTAVIKYGINMTDLSHSTDMSGDWNAVMAYWKGETDRYTDIVHASAGSSYQTPVYFPQYIVVDATTEFNERPTTQQLYTWAANYVTDHAKPMFPSSIKVSFVQLWQTDEYANVAPLQHLHLGDTVQIVHEKLGVNSSARIVEYKYDVLLERYQSMEIGAVAASITSSIRSDIGAVRSEIETADATQWQIYTKYLKITDPSDDNNYIAFRYETDENSDNPGFNPERLLLANGTTSVSFPRLRSRALRLPMGGTFYSEGYTALSGEIRGITSNGQTGFYNGKVTCPDGNNRTPVGSNIYDGNGAAILSTYAPNSSTSGTHYRVAVHGQWGVAGASYTAKYVSTIDQNTSDIRLKENVEDTDVNALEAIEQLKLRQFDWKEDGRHQEIGFVADEMEEVDPLFSLGGGYTPDDGSLYPKTVNLLYLTSYLTKAVQELSEKVKRLEAIINDNEL